MNFSLADSLADCPIIAAAKNDEGLEQALSSDSPVVFLLYGSVCSVAGQTRRVAAAGKVPFVHADLIDGLSAREVAVDFIAAQTAAAGISSTKPVSRPAGLKISSRSKSSCCSMECPKHMEIA